MMGIGGMELVLLPVYMLIYLVPAAVALVALYFVVHQAVYAGIKKYVQENGCPTPAAPQPAPAEPAATAQPTDGSARPQGM